MVDGKKIKQLDAIFRLYPKIKLVYLFGSSVDGSMGPLSDIDFAFYVDEKDTKKIYDIKFGLMDKLSRELGTDKIDIVMLNTAKAPELKYSVISEGKLIYEKEPYKILVEPKILSEYFDFRSFLLRHNLTKAQ